MLQALLELFTTPEKATAMLESPIIEAIFTALFGLFVITLIIHIALYVKIKRTRNYVKDTKRLDIEPLHTIQTEFTTRQQDEEIKLDTFIQEKFSSWNLFHIPVVNLIKLVQMTISVFILLGVLGTFIGLTISLGSISASSDQLIENVAGVLSGIDVAFYTSIVGMSFSLIITVLIRTLNVEYLLIDLMLITESLLESQEEYGTKKLISSIQSLEQTNEKALSSIVEAFDGFKDYTEGLKQSAEDLAKFNDGLSQNLEDFHVLFDQMKTVTDGFQAGTTELNDNFGTLFTYFEKMDERNERITDGFEVTYEKMQETSDAQIRSLKAFEASAENVKDFTSSLLDGQADVRESLDKINEKTEALADVMGAHNQTFKQLFGEDISMRLSGVATYLADLKTGFDRVGDSITSLPEALEVISQTQRDHYHLLGDRFRELKQFNERFGDHLRRYEQEAEAYEKQLRIAAATFEQIATKNSSQLHEMNRMMTQANKVFVSRDQELESTMKTIRDTIVNHASTVENTIGQRLDTMIRQLDNSLYGVSENFSKEVTEMRRSQEELNQNQVRLLQQVLQELAREVQTFNRQLTARDEVQRIPPQTTGLNRDE